MGNELIVGIDEAGRGPIAGPVCVGLVAWRLKDWQELSSKFEDIKDSKKLNPGKREEWFNKIKSLKNEGKLFYTYSMMSARSIDKFGIVHSINASIYKCLNRTGVAEGKSKILLDGALRAPKRFHNQITIIKGDEKFPIISAASVVAKVTRDRKMFILNAKYPKYGFDAHKGYGTKEHYKKLKQNGRSPIHRKTFL